MNPAVLITILEPVVGTVGWYLSLGWLFWVGVAFCFITLFLNIASGVMAIPILPTIFMGIAAAFLSPWYFGLGVGLLAYTALEALGDLMGVMNQPGGHNE